MARLEGEYEQRLADLEDWTAMLQAAVDRHGSKLDTGTLSLRSSVNTMGSLLDSMDQKMGEFDPPIVAKLDPDTIARMGGGRTFLDPFTPFIHQMSKSFDKEELVGLASDMGVNMEVVGGSGLMDMCRRLVAYTRRRSLFEVLLGAIKRERPEVDWDKLRVSPEEKTGHE